MITKNKSNKYACSMQSAEPTPEVRVRELRSNNERSEWRGANKKSQLPTVDKPRNASFAVSVQVWSFRELNSQTFSLPSLALLVSRQSCVSVGLGDETIRNRILMLCAMQSAGADSRGSSPRVAEQQRAKRVFEEPTKKAN